MSFNLDITSFSSSFFGYSIPSALIRQGRLSLSLEAQRGGAFFPDRACQSCEVYDFLVAYVGYYPASA